MMQEISDHLKNMGYTLHSYRSYQFDLPMPSGYGLPFIPNLRFDIEFLDDKGIMYESRFEIYAISTKWDIIQRVMRECKLLDSWRYVFNSADLYDDTNVRISIKDQYTKFKLKAKGLPKMKFT